MQKILRIKEVAATLSVSRWTIRRLVDQGDFPQPVRIGDRSKGWLLSEIEAWEQERMAERVKVAA